MALETIKSNGTFPMKCLRIATVLILLCGATALPADPPPPEQQPKELILDCGNGVTMKLVLIPAGEFTMGTAEDTFTGAAANTSWHWSPDEYKVHPSEKPQHKVRITKPFYMGVYEVTRAQYEALMGPHPSYHEGHYTRFNITNPPVEEVTWYDAVEFCKRLSEKTGRQIRLPTEAEWEYACRAGTTTPFYTGDKLSYNQAAIRPDWIDRDGSKEVPTEKVSEYYHVYSVGSRPPNPWGLYDMLGNMWEWCLDWYDGGYYKKSPVEDPTGPATGTRKALRGGSYDGWPGEARSAIRHEANPPDTRGFNWGFRVVCPTEEIQYAPQKAYYYPPDHRYYNQDEETFGDLKAKYDFIADLPKTWTLRPDPKQEGQKDEWLKGGGLGGGEAVIGRFWAEQGVKHTGDAWYRLVWKTPPLQVPENRKLYLWFGAVSETAVVWVNGLKVGSHEGPPASVWHERFPVEVTGKIKFGEANTIVVKVHNSTLPGGIWKSVKLAVGAPGPVR